MIWNPFDGLVLSCPVCHQSYMHVDRVQTVLCGDESGIGPHRGIEDSYWETDSRFRRPGLVIEFLGECSHRFRLRLQQHKGFEYMFLETIIYEPKPLLADRPESTWERFSEGN